MGYGVRVVCRPDVSPGFRLAGLPTVEAHTPDQAGERVTELRADPGIGVVLLEDALHDQLPEDARRAWGRRPLPMVVPFPGPAWAARPEGAEAYIVELLRQVVGYRVRLR